MPQRVGATVMKKCNANDVAKRGSEDRALNVEDDDERNGTMNALRAQSRCLTESNRMKKGEKRTNTITLQLDEIACEDEAFAEAWLSKEAIMRQHPNTRLQERVIS